MNLKFVILDALDIHYILLLDHFSLKEKKRSPQEEYIEQNSAHKNEFIDEDDTSEEVVNFVCQIMSKFRKISKYVKNSPKEKEKLSSLMPWRDLTIVILFIQR